MSSYPSPRGSAGGSPQFHHFSFSACRHLLRRRSTGCHCPFSTPEVSGFAHRTKARLPETHLALTAMPARSPLRRLRLFALNALRPANSSRRSDCLRVLPVGISHLSTLSRGIVACVTTCHARQTSLPKWTIRGVDTLQSTRKVCLMGTRSMSVNGFPHVFLIHPPHFLLP